MQGYDVMNVFVCRALVFLHYSPYLMDPSSSAIVSSSIVQSSSVVHRSVLLSTFPWLTDFLLGTDARVENVSLFAVLFFFIFDDVLLFTEEQNFYQTLTQFERDIVCPSTTELIDLKAALAIVDAGSPMPTEEPDMHNRVPAKLSQMLAAYKVKDLFHAMQDPIATQGRNPTYSRMPMIGIAKGNLASDSITTLLFLLNG